MAKRDKGASADETKADAPTEPTDATTSSSDELSELRARLEVAERSVAQWKAEAELQSKNAADWRLKAETKAAAAAGPRERFRGTLKDACEQHFQKRESSWDHLTVIYDQEA